MLPPADPPTEGVGLGPIVKRETAAGFVRLALRPLPVRSAVLCHLATSGAS